MAHETRFCKGSILAEAIGTGYGTLKRHDMNQDKLELLISIRDITEAQIVREFDSISIVDLKDPFAGSLGCVDFETARSIIRLLPRTQTTSIALGEAIDGMPWLQVPAQEKRALLQNFQFAKFGLAGLANRSDWVSVWKSAFDSVPNSVQRVAVAYADSEQADAPQIESIVEAASEIGCGVLLLDTFQKSDGNLLEHVQLPRLKSIIATASQQDMKVGLAGSLDASNLTTVKQLSADFLAVRGAVCGAARTSIIKRNRISELLQNL